MQGAGSTKGASGVFRSNNSSGHGSNSRSGGRAPYTGASSAPSDVHHRPMPRVILLSGPPGLGKTTLAHVCAVHCGYHPVEMNARYVHSTDCTDSPDELHVVMIARRSSFAILLLLRLKCALSQAKTHVQTVLSLTKLMEPQR